MQNDHIEKLSNTSFYLTDSHGLTVIEKALLLAAELPCVELKDGYKIQGYVNVEELEAFTVKQQQIFNAWKETYRKVKLSDKWWEIDDGENVDYLKNKGAAK